MHTCFREGILITTLVVGLGYKGQLDKVLD